MTEMSSTSFPQADYAISHGDQEWVAEFRSIFLSHIV